MKKFLKNLFRKNDRSDEEKISEFEEEKVQEKENEDVKDIYIEKKDKINSNLKIKREEKNREIKFQKTLEYFNLPSDTTKEELQQVIEKNKGKKLQDKKKKEKVKNSKEDPKNLKKEIIPIEAIPRLSDEEILEKFDKLTKPFNLILDELTTKEKEWMPDEKRDACENLIHEINNHYYFPIDLQSLEFLLENSDELVLDDFLDNIPILRSKPIYDLDKSTGFENIDKCRLAFETAHIEFFKIVWSFFGIKEDLLKVYKLFEKVYLTEGRAYAGNKDKRDWDSYQKTFFYHDKNQVKRIFNLCLDIFKNEEQLLDSSEDFENEDLDKETFSGFVYFIRNQDIYKIGITQNMIQRMEQLKPDELLDSIRCSNYKELEREIHNEFKGCRIPQTEYFRLDKEEINKVHAMLRDKAK